MNLSEIVRSGAQMMLQYALEREVTEALGRGYYENAPETTKEKGRPVVYADETSTGWKQGGRRVWLWVFTNLRETVYEILPGRGFEFFSISVLVTGRLGAGEKLRGHPRGRRLGPLPLLQGSDATDLLQPSAAPLPRATGDGHVRSPVGHSE